MLVFLPADIPNIPSLLKQQLIQTLQRYTLNEVVKKLQGPSTDDPASRTVWPTAVFCSRQDVAALSKVEMRAAGQDANQWEAEMAEGMRRAACDNSPWLGFDNKRPETV